MNSGKATINLIVIKTDKIQEQGILQPDTSTRLGFDVEYLDQLVQNLGDKGIKILSETSKGESGYGCVVQDINGRKIELTESNQLIR